MSAELTATDELAEAEMYVRDLAASWAGSGGGAKIAAVLAEFDRRGQIEQRIQERLRTSDAMVKALGRESHLSDEGHASRRALQWVLRP